MILGVEVREDAIELIGFLSPTERALFHLLRKVKGLGPRTSLNVLSGMPARDLVGAIAHGDVARLQTIAGVGKRYAERIVVECREGAGAMANGGGPSETLPATDGVTGQAVSALVNLGYKHAEAERAVKKAAAPGAALEDLIRAALKAIGGGLGA